MKNILILEDEVDMQEIYRDMFKNSSQEYRIEVIGNAEHALKRLNEKKFDLLIVDIIMEPMSGDTFFVYVRNNPELAQLPIIVISVLNPETLSLLKQINHVSFMQKPITKERLFKEIENTFIPKK